ncbi:50S ribosomal protein L10 [Candidatus Parcubacteria bacterium]|nr:50S ribosomal protein L10 [Candidatus Parcubacteria bacterium]
MAKTKAQKVVIFNDLKEKLDQSKSVVFVSFDSLTVSDNNDLRQKLREQDSEYLVVKKTLLRLTLDKIGFKDIDVKQFKGKIAAVFGYEDEVAPAKVIADFQKEHEETFEFAGGILENNLISAEEVKKLSGLPGKNELYAKLVGSINAPVSGFVNVLAGNLRGLVNVLKAVQESK